jgi:hypothetical protein
MQVADLAHVPLGQDAAVVDEEDAPGHGLDLVQDVARHEDGPSLAAQLLHEVHDPPPVHGVHPAERLVEQEHLRIVGQRLRHLDALAHAFAVPADLAVARLGSATCSSAWSARRRHSASSNPVRRSRASRNWSPVRPLPERVRLRADPDAMEELGRAQAGRPSTRTSPWLGASWPAASLRNVDLPARWVRAVPSLPARRSW